MYNLEQVPHQFKNVPNKIIAPTMAMKASSIMLSSDQKHSQKWGAADLSSNVVGLDPTGNDEQACPPAKKGKPSLIPNKQAAGHTPEMPCCPARKAKKQGIQCTGVFTYNIWLGDIVSNNIYLETMMQIDGPNLLVWHSDDTVTVSSVNNNLDVDKDATPHESNFHTDEISEPPKDEPTGAPSKADNKVWPIPSALKKGHSFQDAFQNEVDLDSGSSLESEQAKRDMRERGKYNSMVCLIFFWFMVYCLLICGMSINSNCQLPGIPISTLLLP